MHVNGHPLTVVGVAAAGSTDSRSAPRADVYVPLTMQPLMGPAWLKMNDRRFHWVQVFGRLAPG